MKKLGIFVAILAILIGGVYWAVSSGKADENEIYNFIDGVAFEEKIDNKESFVLYEYGEYCNYCKQFAPMIEGYLAEKDYQINKIVTDTSEENYRALNKVLGEKQQGTPAVYVFKDGELIDYMVGLPTQSDFDAFTTKNNKYFSLPHAK